MDSYLIISAEYMYLNSKIAFLNPSNNMYMYLLK